MKQRLKDRTGGLSALFSAVTTQHIIVAVGLGQTHTGQRTQCTGTSQAHHFRNDARQILPHRARRRHSSRVTQTRYA